jgi:surface protein
MFAGCSGLTSLDLSGFDTSEVTTMANMFGGCSGLTSIDLSEFDTSNVENMESMFYICSSLKEIKGIENWDCSKVAKFGSMFQGAKAFGGDLDLRNWKVGQNTTVTSIYSFMNWCENIKSVDMSGWILPDNTNLANFMANQGSLHTVRVIGWSAVNIQNLCSVIGCYVGGTIYGGVIIDETYLQNNWVYDNALEVAIYTCSTSGVLPTFNTEFTYTHTEVDNGDGTYTTKVVTDSLDNLPTKISFQRLTSLLTVEKLNTSNVIHMANMFNGCSALIKIKDIEKWDVSNVVDADSVFRGCKSITSLELTNWQLSNIDNAYGIAQMFMECSKLTEIKGVNNLLCNGNIIKRIDDMFNGCTNLTSLDLSGFDTSKVTTMSSMFNGCLKLTSLDVSNFDTSNVTNMSMMFKNCNNLTTLNVSNFDTSKVTNMGEMFSGCNVLSIEGLGNWDVKNVTDMGSMFLHCRGITSLLEISDWDTSSLKNLYRTFMGCTELIELDVSNWNTSKLETLLETFYSCSKIISFNLGNWDCRRVTSINGTFHGCSSLSSIILPKEVRKGCNAVSALRNCTNLKEVALPKGIGNISHMLNNCYNLEKAVIPLDDITDVQDTTFNNCRALVNIDWVGDLSNNFNIINKPGEYVTTESDVHELMTNLGDLKKDKIKISLSKGTIKVNDTEKTIE